MSAEYAGHQCQWEGRKLRRWSSRGVVTLRVLRPRDVEVETTVHLGKVEEIHAHPVSREKRYNSVEIEIAIGTWHIWKM